MIDVNISKKNGELPMVTLHFFIMYKKRRLIRTPGWVFPGSVQLLHACTGSHIPQKLILSINIKAWMNMTNILLKAKIFKTQIFILSNVYKMIGLEYNYNEVNSKVGWLRLKQWTMFEEKKHLVFIQNKFSTVIPWRPALQMRLQGQI